jgi:hypothetical protein
MEERAGGGVAGGRAEGFWAEAAADRRISQKSVKIYAGMWFWCFMVLR